MARVGHAWQQADTLHFEPLAEAHLDEVMRIEVEAYPEPWTRGMFRDEIRSPLSHVDAAMGSAWLIGYCGFWLTFDEAHITTLTVRRESRGQGLGRVLLDHLISRAEAAGAASLTLEVRESNLPARHIYATSGFQATGRRRGYYPKTNEDALVMTRPVSLPES